MSLIEIMFSLLMNRTSLVRGVVLSVFGASLTSVIPAQQNLNKGGNIVLHTLFLP